MSELDKDLRAITADGTAWAVMVGVGETYLPAFVLAISASQMASGLVTTIPLLMGAAMQVVAPLAVRRIGSCRKWTVLCAMVQMAAFAPLAIAAIIGAMPVAMIFAVAAIYWAAGMAGGPAWNAWVETLVPKEIRARYFARRTRLCQVGLLAGFVIGGMLLHTVRFDKPLTAFALLFLVAGIARAISAYCLGCQREPDGTNADFSASGWRAMAASLRSEVDLRVLLYLLAMQAAAWVAGPYFAAYMFVHLGLSYMGFMVLACMAVLAKILCLPLFGKAVERWGANRVLWASGLAMAVAPALWALGGGFGYLCLVQVFAGAAWGAYELAMMLVFFETIPRRSRIHVLTVFNLANAIAVTGGSLVGAMVLAAFGAGQGTYMILFLASAAARGLSLLLLVRLPKLSFRSTVVAARAIAIGPTVGAIERPILSSLSTEAAAGGRQEPRQPSMWPPGAAEGRPWEPTTVHGAAQASAFASCEGDGLVVATDTEEYRARMPSPPRKSGQSPCERSRDPRSTTPAMLADPERSCQPRSPRPASAAHSDRHELRRITLGDAPPLDMRSEIEGEPVLELRR